MTHGRYGVIFGGLSFLAVLVAGGMAGLLYAPQSGARTRRQLACVADDAKERAGRWLKTRRRQHNEWSSAAARW